MVWIENKNLLFIHVPKTGGTSIETMLGALNSQCGYGIKNRKAMQHYLWNDFLKIFGQQRFNRYFKFSVVRNPYDRFLSEYYWTPIKGLGNKSKQSIDDFIKCVEEIVKNRRFNATVSHDHFIPQVEYIYDSEKNLKVNKLFKFENFNEVLDFLSKRYNIKKIDKVCNSTTKDKLKLTEVQKDRIYKIYEKDFKILCYPK
jgi:hypothetical protein